jgi:hypothetical protein
MYQSRQWGKCALFKIKSKTEKVVIFSFGKTQNSNQDSHAISSLCRYTTGPDPEFTYTEPAQRHKDRTTLQKKLCLDCGIPPPLPPGKSNKHASPETRHASAAPTGHQHVRGARLWHQYAGAPQSVHPGLLPPTLLWTNCNRWLAITVTVVVAIIKVGNLRIGKRVKRLFRKNKYQLFTRRKSVCCWSTENRSKCSI